MIFDEERIELNKWGEKGEKRSREKDRKKEKKKERKKERKKEDRKKEIFRIYNTKVLILYIYN